MAAGRIRRGSRQCPVHRSRSRAIRNRPMTQRGHRLLMFVVMIIVILVFVNGPASASRKLLGRHRGNEWFRAEPIVHMAGIAVEDRN